MKKVLGLLLLCATLAFAEELTEAQIAEKQAKLAAAEEQAAEAKAEIATAQAKLDAAQKIIKRKELLLPAGEGGAVVYATHVELGYVSTSGNTDTKSGSFDGMTKAEWGKNALKLDIDYLYGEEDDIENNNKFIAELNYDYKFSEKFSFNYFTGYKIDKFSGFDYQLYTGPGAKYHALNSDAHILDFQSNVLYSEDSEMDKFYDALGNEVKYPYVDPAKDPLGTKESGETNDYASFFIKGDYTWTITESFKFLQMLNYRVDLEDEDVYFVNSKTAFESKINGTFSMGVNYKVSYVNSAPDGNERTDKTFTVALIIDY